MVEDRRDYKSLLNSKYQAEKILTEQEQVKTVEDRLQWVSEVGWFKVDRKEVKRDV